MIRVFVLYGEEPDPERYEQHVELCRKVPNAVFRHGRVTRTLMGSELAYYAEFEFPDAETFKASAASDAFQASGVDAEEMGYPRSIYFADVD
jgi:hypothetical protein